MGLFEAEPDTYLPRNEGGLIAIDYVHAKIHQGLHFTATTYHSDATATNIIVTAPATGVYHFVAEVVTNGPAAVYWSRTPDIDATGSSIITAYNNDEASENTSTLTHKLGGVYASSGTLLNRWLIGSATGNPGQPVNLGGGASHSHEWELLASSTHLLRVVKGASCETVIRLSYYREE